MESSKIKPGVQYAMRTKARSSRWGDGQAQRVQVIKAIPEKKRRYDDFIWERKVKAEHGAQRTYGIVAGRTLFLVRMLDQEGKAIIRDEVEQRVIVSGGCILQTWSKYQDEQAAAKKAREEQAEREKVNRLLREQDEEALTARQIALNGDLVNLLALDAVTELRKVWSEGRYVDATMTIKLSDLEILVMNTVEVLGGRPE